MENIESERGGKMKTYQFTSGTSRGDMIMGLVFPAGLMLPVLITYFILFYSRLWNSLKDKPLLLSIMFLPGLFLAYLIINKNRNKCRKEFIVYLDELDIAVMEDGNEVMKGRVLFCHIKVVENKSVMLDIETREEKISFRARPREYKTVTGNTSFNPFGTSDANDMEQLTGLGREINRRLEKENV